MKKIPNSFTEEDWKILNGMISHTTFKSEWFFPKNDSIAIESIHKVIEKCRKIHNYNYDTWKSIFRFIFYMPIKYAPLHMNEEGFTALIMRWRLQVGK